LKLSKGKQKGLTALSNERGVIAALALDQRSALRRLFATASGCAADDIPGQWLANFKTEVSKLLTPYASAILLDPEYGLTAAAQRDSHAGLLLAYEKTGYDKSVPGRLPSTLDGFSVTRLQEAGADAVKVLLYYSPFSPAQVNAKKYAWVRQVSDECATADVAFFLEIVCYHDDMDEKGPEFARVKPDVVVRAVEEFSNPRYAVDVIKIGVPVNMKFVRSAKVLPEQGIYTREEAIAHFRKASDACSVPFIYLSEGVSNELFEEALDIATTAGAAFSGVLCGRATWQDGVRVFVNDGAEGLDAWLRVQGAKNIQSVNSRLTAAHPWQERIRIVEGRTA